MKRLFSFSILETLNKISLTALKLIDLFVISMTRAISRVNYSMCLNDKPEEWWCKLPYQISKNVHAFMEMIVKSIVGVTFAISVDAIPVFEMKAYS